MADVRAPPIPPPGERKDYICRLEIEVPGLWILKRDAGVGLYEDLVTSGISEPEAMREAGGIFYATDSESAQLTKEEVEAKEALFKHLEEDFEKYLEEVKRVAVEMWMRLHILNTDPWFRPQEDRTKTVLVRDEEGGGVWVVTGDHVTLDSIEKSRDMGEDYVKLIEESGGIHYGSLEDLSGIYNVDEQL